MKGVEVDDEEIRGQRGHAVAGYELVTTREPAMAAPCAKRVVHSCSDVDGLVVEKNPDLGALRRRLPFVRLRLAKACDRRRLIPRRLVESSVDSYVATATRCGGAETRVLTRGGCGLCIERRGGGDRQDRRKHQAWDEQTRTRHRRSRLPA